MNTSRNLRITALGVACALAVIGGGVALRSSLLPRGTPPPVGATVAPTMPVAPPARRWFDGVALPAGVSAQPSTLAIVIDNAPEANPQSGLADAPLVVEVPVEGGRTRFLAVFSPRDANARAVGPVRSLRPYLTAIARGLHVPITHVGGSPAALAGIRAKRWPHIDQYFAPPFHRVTFRRAPFNVYTTLEALDVFTGGRWDGERYGDPRPLWAFAESSDRPVSSAGAPDPVSVPFGGPTTISWRYEPSRRAYVRSQNSREHRDANGKPMIAENVVMLSVRTRVLDAVGRLEIPIFEHPCDLTAGDALASRRAVVLTDGERREGEWSWPDVTTCGGERGMIEFRSKDGPATPLTLRPGRTWVELVPGSVE